MKAYWSQTRANGQPVTSGVCRVIDHEDGTNPIYVYGQDAEEVYGKIERMNSNAQAALARRARPAAPPPGRDPVPPVPARAVSADQIAQATADLDNPAKASQAVATLFEAATGIDPQRQAQLAFRELGERWMQRNPDFYDHPGNVQLMGHRAYALTNGKLGAATMEMLDQIYGELKAKGMLFEREAPLQSNEPPNPPPSRPGESPAPHVAVRPRGTQFATGYSSRSSASIPTNTPKYSEHDIRTMPERKRRELLESNDADYTASCEYWYGQGNRAAS